MKLFFFIFFASVSQIAFGFTASKVWYEFHPFFFRIYIRYTVPALKEAREAYIDIKNKKEAERFFWSAVRGGDFFIYKNKIIFDEKKPGPTPW